MRRKRQKQKAIAWPGVEPGLEASEVVFCEASVITVTLPGCTLPNNEIGYIIYYATKHPGADN